MPPGDPDRHWVSLAASAEFRRVYNTIRPSENFRNRVKLGSLGAPGGVSASLNERTYPAGFG